MKLWICSILVLASACGAGETLDPNLPYQAERANPVTYDVDFSVVVTAPYKTNVLKVWLPLPQSDAGQKVSEGSITTFPSGMKPKITTEKVYGNKFAYFEFKEPLGGQLIRHRFKVKVWELRWNVEADKVTTIKDWPVSFAPYLKGEQQAVVTDEGFDNVLAQIVPQRGNSLKDMSLVMDYVIKDFKYDHANASLRASSTWALEKKTGHCSDYHGFCSALGRLLGSPTRITYGINPFPKNSPSHCKMEAFLPPYGWVSFDVSETQKLMEEIKTKNELDDATKQKLLTAARERLIRGFRDNTWFLQTRGSDYELEPPAAQRVPVIRTIYAEADGVALPDSDSADPKQNRFAWMTVHKFTPDKDVPYAFKDLKTLETK